MDVQIEAITVSGVAGFDQERFGQALSAELGRLAAGSAARGGAWQVARIELEIPARADSAAIGVQVARAIFDHISGVAGW